MNNAKRLINEITTILELIKETIPEENIRDANDLLKHNEWGEALTLICTQLYEYDVPIKREVYNRIEATGHQMQMSPEEWKMLKELIAG